MQRHKRLLAAEPVDSYGSCVQIRHGTASDGSRVDPLAYVPL